MTEIRLETERLLLRPFGPEDLDLVALLYGDPELLRYTPFDVLSPTQAKAHLDRIVTDWREDPLRSLEFVMARKPAAGEAPEEKLGRCHILIDPETDTGMIGWFLRREYRGMGYAREAGRALIRACFRTLGLHRVNAVCHPENLASRRALERCGLRLEAWFRRKCPYRKNGALSWEDELEYALLASEWAGGEGAPGRDGLPGETRTDPMRPKETKQDAADEKEVD